MGMPLFCGFFPPSHGFLTILHDTCASGIHQSKIVLGFGMPLFCGFFQPIRCLQVVPFYTIIYPKIELGISIALLGAFYQLLQFFRFIAMSHVRHPARMSNDDDGNPWDEVCVFHDGMLTTLPLRIKHFAENLTA